MKTHFAGMRDQRIEFFICKKWSNASMKQDSRYGFNVIELAAVTAVVMLLVLALIPAVAHKVKAANTTAVGVRGKDIYVAIASANMEREPLGLPSVWPSENPPITNRSPRDVECFNFSNSTDYFSYLYDGGYLGTDRRNQYFLGDFFSKLAGDGVPACTQGKLTAEHNMWTIAMNVTDDLADIVPILITRNIDASSLAAKVTDEDRFKSLRFDPEWEKPFGEWGFVLIRKGGSVFRARDKYATYRAVYQEQTFDATVDQKGVPVAHPLKYLTPTRTVVPGEQAYAEGALRVEQLTGSSGKRIRRALEGVRHGMLPACAPFAVLYLLVACACGVRRACVARRIGLAGYGLGFCLVHVAAIVGWMGLLWVMARRGAPEAALMLAGLALLAQAAGLAFVAAGCRDDREARQRGMKRLVAAPLIAMGGLFLLLVLGAFAN